MARPNPNICEYESSCQFLPETMNVLFSHPCLTGAASMELIPSPGSQHLYVGFTPDVDMVFGECSDDPLKEWGASASLECDGCLLDFQVRVEGNHGSLEALYQVFVPYFGEPVDATLQLNLIYLSCNDPVWDNYCGKYCPEFPACVSSTVMAHLSMS